MGDSTVYRLRQEGRALAAAQNQSIGGAQIALL